MKLILLNIFHWRLTKYTTDIKIIIPKFLKPLRPEKNWTCDYEVCTQYTFEYISSTWNCKKLKLQNVCTWPKKGSYIVNATAVIHIRVSTYTLPIIIFKHRRKRMFIFAHNLSNFFSAILHIPFIKYIGKKKMMV